MITFLDANPELYGFIARFDTLVESLYADATTSIQWVYFDAWDPPIILEARSTIPEDVDSFRDMQWLRDWVSSDPAWGKREFVTGLRRSAVPVGHP